MTGPIKVVLWTTTFQADILALARYMCRDARFEPLVVLQDKEAFLKEPIQKLLPVTCPMLERDDKDTLKQIKAFHPHVTVVDNHFPPKKLSQKLFVLWHGFGWKGPNDVPEFATIHKSIKKLTGASSMAPNDNFMWQCFGPTDLEHRHHVSGFAKENLASLGAAFTDELLQQPVSREEALEFYPDLPKGKKVALIALTWHYGKAFAHWGDDFDIFTRILDYLKEKNCAAIIRMHDRKRFESEYLERLESLVAERDDVIIKFKDRDRDSMLDLVVSDVMVSNFSSILNYYYATLKPSIHVYPVKSSDEAFLWRTWKKGKIRVRTVENADYVWKLPPEENGGLMAKSLDELLMAFDKALTSPDCCQTQSRTFCERHMAPVDGRTCDRICEAIVQLAASKGV
ncbi:MAG: CDP-glycerol glycerophosphotransferase family protein [Deltaproteobacteria bacterium]|nr:CDP-glycerol glycerophosphotransferase family protein [Deltaproteobacteria bacterium]